MMTIENQQHYIVQAEASGPTVCFSVQPPDDTLGEQIARKVLTLLQEFTDTEEEEPQDDHGDAAEWSAHHEAEQALERAETEAEAAYAAEISDDDAEHDPSAGMV